MIPINVRRQDHEINNQKTNATGDFSEFMNHGRERQIEEEREPQKIKATFSMRSSVFDREASHRRFLYGEDKTTVDVSETGIAAGAMKEAVGKALGGRIPARRRGS